MKPARVALSDYLAGSALIGEDFTEEQVRQWFADEKEAYARLRGHRNAYEYHRLNEFHGFRFLPRGAFSRVLCFGGYDGAEIQPLKSQIDHIVIADTAAVEPVVEAQHLSLPADGTLPVASNTFDLVTCLNVLHHIPKPSLAIAEVSRCLIPGGHAIFTEPIVSMGDWTHPRPGLTARERGIPPHIFAEFLDCADLRVIQYSRCAFGPLVAMARLARVNPWASRLIVLADSLLCKLPLNRNVYHASNTWQKIRATCAFWVVQKSGVE